MTPSHCNGYERHTCLRFITFLIWVVCLSSGTLTCLLLSRGNAGGYYWLAGAVVCTPVCLYMTFWKLCRDREYDAI